MLINHGITIEQEMASLGEAQPRGEWLISIPGIMRGKGRPRFSVRGGKPRAYTDDKTVSMEGWVRHCAMEQVGQILLEGPLSVEIDVEVPIPKSWTQRERAAAEIGRRLPTGKPDVDNIVKLLADALNGVLWRDDSQICRLVAIKAYGPTPSTKIRVARA